MCLFFDTVWSSFLRVEVSPRHRSVHEDAFTCKGAQQLNDAIGALSLLPREGFHAQLVAMLVSTSGKSRYDFVRLQGPLGAIPAR
jgi:hypothetical protein